MTIKVKCPNCGEIREIVHKSARFFRCCHNQWLISNHVAFKSEHADVPLLRVKRVGKLREPLFCVVKVNDAEGGDIE